MKRYANSWRKSESGKLPLEHDEQAWFFSAVRTRANFDSRYRAIYAIPNMAKRSFMAYRYMRDEGLEPGVLDVCVAYPAGGHHGAYIEFKRRGERLRDNQAFWKSLFETNGYATTVQFSGAEAFDWLEKYLAGEL